MCGREREPKSSVQYWVGLTVASYPIQRRSRDAGGGGGGGEEKQNNNH